MATTSLTSPDHLPNLPTLHNNHPHSRTSRCRRKRTPSHSTRRSILPLPLPSKAALVMGQIKILKRGQDDFNPSRFFSSDRKETTPFLRLDLSSTKRIGPDPDIVQKQVRVPYLYAGSTLTASAPPPSSLPFPTALVRRSAVEFDLRKLLKTSCF